MRPAHTGDEEHGGQRAGVDERRADVRLDEDERNRHEAVAERRQHGFRRGDRASPVGEEAGQREHEQHLAELGRLECEEADVDPTVRAARGGAGGEHEQHDPERPEVDRPAQAAVAVGIDEQHEHEEHGTDDCVHALPRGGRAARVVLRDPVDRPQPVTDDTGEGEISTQSSRRSRPPSPTTSASRRLRNPRALVSTASIAISR